MDDQRTDRPNPHVPDVGPQAGTRLSAVEIHDNVLAPGEEELRRPAGALFWSALASGLVIGFSFLAGGFVASLAPAELRHAAAAAVYPLGFILVIMARSELFTENTLVPVIPLLNRRDRETFRQLVRVWATLLIGNLLGALAYSMVLARTPMVSADLHPPLLEIATRATEGGFWIVAYQAVFAGWLIALLSWLLAATRATGAQLVLIWLTTAPIAAFTFRHSIAGAVEAFYRAAVGAAPWGAMLGEFVLPAVLGNAVGGVLLVALLNYSQVAAERAKRAPA
ncbi:formate/nitrite transporter family protein [soil metagenome]